MLDIAKRYEQNYGNPHHAIRAFVRDLMAGDPAEFKQGYTRPNAIAAAAYAFDVDRDAVVRHLQKEQS